MRSKHKPLSEFIEEINSRDSNVSIERLLGVSIQKKFIPSIANTIGTDMSTYKIINKNQFAYGPVTSRNSNRISIALLEEFDEAIVSQAYTVFQIKDSSLLMPQYLNMWFKRSEFDRFARFKSHGSAREIFNWEEMCNTLLPVPSLEKQKEFVKQYNVIQARLSLNENLIVKIEGIIQTIYRKWFLDYDFPGEDGKPYRSNGGAMVHNHEIEKDIPENWELKPLRDIISVIDNRGKTPPCSKKITPYPLIEIGAICDVGRVINFLKCEKYVDKDIFQNWFRSGHPKKKDILFSTVGSLAEMKIYWTNIGCIAQNIVSFRCKDDMGLFLYQTLVNSKNDLVSYEIGSVQASIKVSQIIEFKVLIPKPEVVARFEKLSESLTNYISVKSFENIKLIELKNLLLSKLTKSIN